MRSYELVLVFDPGLEVEVIEADLRKLTDMIAANGLMRRWERWGKRRLSYEIRGRQYGYYVLAVFDTEAAMVAELDRTVRINSAIIRHLITLVDPKRVPEVDLESIRTLGAAPEVVPEAPAPAPVAATEPAAEAAPAAPESDAAVSTTPESAA